MLKLSDEKVRKILKVIDKTPEHELKRIMGKKYIDTPGNFKDEKNDYYNDIVVYMERNMGHRDFERLLKWISSHPKEVRTLMRLYK